MIFNARIGSVEMMIDTDTHEHTPTPEWCEDVLRRLSRQLVDMYTAIPDSRVADATPAAPEPDLEQLVADDTDTLDGDGS